MENPKINSMSTRIHLKFYFGGLSKIAIVLVTKKDHTSFKNNI